MDTISHGVKKVATILIWVQGEITQSHFDTSPADA